MAFDGIVTKTIISELNEKILDGKINKIFQPSKNEIILGIYINGKNYALNICIDSANCRLNLTTTAKSNPLVAPNFCMLLRKHLIGYRIKSISNYDLERVITIGFEGFNELNDLTQKKLLIELMGRHSNIILLNNHNYIIDSLRHLDTYSHSNRDILPAHEYTFPETNKISFISLTTFSDFYNYIYNDISKYKIDKILSNKFIGISMSFVQHVLSTLSIENTTNFDIDDLQKVYDYIKNIIENIGSNKLSCIEINSPKKDFVIDLLTKDDCLQVNFFIDDFYSNKEVNENFISYRNNILKLILSYLNKYTTRLANIDSKLAECENRNMYKLYGELITANLYKIPKENLSEITLENYYDNNSLITIPLDKTITVPNNAKKYFKKYNKLKNALEIVQKQKIATKYELEYIESIIYELENCKNINEVDDIYTEISESILFKEALNKKKEKKNRYAKNKASNSTPLEYTINDFTILVGKNNKQNDYLTTKIATNNDIWFHTKDIHGSHVILKVDGKDISEDTLIKCAQIAAYHSKAKFSSKVPVDYCYVKYVKKPSGSKPGMVIYTNNKTLYVDPIIPK